MNRIMIHLLGWTLLLVALTSGLATRAHADAISYALTLCEDLDVLKDPTNKTLAMNAAWKPQHTLMMERTFPYFELKNTSEEAVITQFSMTIGDVSKNFDWANLIEASPGVTANVLTVDSVMGGTKSDVLTISFSGLAPGDFVRFQIGLSADDPNAGLLQDYRMILFQLDGTNTSNNSVVTSDFMSSNGVGTLSDQLPNFSMGGMPTSTDMQFPHQYGMDMIMPFEFTDNGNIEPMPPVPEPASLVLFGCGLIGLALWRWRQLRV